MMLAIALTDLGKHSILLQQVHGVAVPCHPVHAERAVILLFEVEPYGDRPAGLRVRTFTGVADKGRAALLVVIPLAVDKKVIQHFAHSGFCGERTVVTLRKAFGAGRIRVQCHIQHPAHNDQHHDANDPLNEHGQTVPPEQFVHLGFFFFHLRGRDHFRVEQCDHL